MERLQPLRLRVLSSLNESRLHSMHYCLAGVQHATWESVHGVISNCSADPKCGAQCDAQAVVNNAVVGANGEWVWAQCCGDCGTNAAIFMFAGQRDKMIPQPFSESGSPAAWMHCLQG